MTNFNIAFEECGANSDGLRTTQFPAAIAEATGPMPVYNG